MGALHTSQGCQRKTENGHMLHHTSERRVPEALHCSAKDSTPGHSDNVNIGEYSGWLFKTNPHTNVYSSEIKGRDRLWGIFKLKSAHATIYGSFWEYFAVSTIWLELLQRNKESSAVERKNSCESIFLMSSYIKGMDFACILCIRVCIDINLSLGVSLLDDTWSIIHWSRGVLFISLPAHGESLKILFASSDRHSIEANYSSCISYETCSPLVWGYLWRRWWPIKNHELRVAGNQLDKCFIFLCLSNRFSEFIWKLLTERVQHLKVCHWTDFHPKSWSKIGTWTWVLCNIHPAPKLCTSVVAI